MIQKVDHLGIAVKNLEESVAFYEKTLGLKCEGIEEVPSQKVRTAFFHAGETHIELLEATDPESPIAKFVEKNGQGIHHVAYGVDDVQAHLDKAAAEGCRLIHDKPFEGAANKMVAFLHPKSTQGVLTELCMPKS